MIRYFASFILILFSFEALAAACSSNGSSFTGTCESSVTSYKVTLKSVRLHKVGDPAKTFVTIASGEKEFDIGSVGAGQTVGNYVNNAIVPFGSYDQLVFVIDKTVEVKASTDGGSSNDCATSSSGSGNVSVASGASAEFVDVVENAPQSPGYVSGDDHFIVMTSSDISEFPITVTEDSGFHYKMRFNLDEAVEYTYSSGSCTSGDTGNIAVTASING